jgi:hypothetical protein
MLKRRLTPKELKRPNKKRRMLESYSSEVESVEEMVVQDLTPIHLIPVEVLNTILLYCAW